ncbi:HAD-IB family phosphatase [Candidatus Falkowbacteria bacterium]|jgi:HAD superfamily phosphoserine phosphatase-like hydrolase|nr:HAD-IB family phosphatase [Candidatus Falkowbacteria bacterium]MBT5503636.1 HAD-IB family phosphatase [Candidatus Falkowbacteria bacterium]MBT6574100.1 HAD-IB family phosphatase [Candidatus Falkowbacteria bacterium]MBT7500694.1 HAD-IB family phosphatase [Candidatus Falkowbacteria bacterium]
MKEYKGLLFLDLDGTFFRWSLFLYMVDKLIETGIFNEMIRKHFNVEEKKWRERKGSYDEYLYKVIEIFEARISGVKVEDFELLGREMVAEYKDQVYRYTRELIKEKKEQGWYITAISCSPEEAVKPFAEAWGMNESHAAEIEQVDGRYTSMRSVPHDKASIAQKIMQRPEFADIPKENIWGIGDSEGDINFLEIVGHPICFNPTLPLYQEAQKRGWNVVVERKNVVYNI